MKDKSYTDKPKAPVCLHWLGQNLVDALHGEGRVLRRERDDARRGRDAARDILAKMVHAIEVTGGVTPNDQPGGYGLTVNPDWSAMAAFYFEACDLIGEVPLITPAKTTK